MYVRIHILYPDVPMSELAKRKKGCVMSEAVEPPTGLGHEDDTDTTVQYHSVECKKRPDRARISV